MDIIQLAEQALSSKKETREFAENSLFKICSQRPGPTFLSLIDASTDPNTEIGIKQFCLLSLRKLITMYWSAGFESYKGPPGVDEEAKKIIRAKLLKMSLDDSHDSKMINSASYCIVQISSVDYPDEWPTLLEEIYHSINENRSLGAINLLNEIFDDVVSEEIFFQNGLGWNTIQIIFQLLSHPTTAINLKIAIMKLYHSCLLQLQSVDAHSTVEKRHFIGEHIRAITALFNHVLAEGVITTPETKLDLFHFQGLVYENLTLINYHFPKKLFPLDYKYLLQKQLVEHLEIISFEYIDNVFSVNEEANLIINDAIIHMISFMSSLVDIEYESSDIPKVLCSLMRISCLTKNQEVDWLGDYNSFVTKETGLSASYLARDECFEFLSNISNPNCQKIFMQIIKEISKTLPDLDWKIQESNIYLLQSICSNEEEFNLSEETISNVIDILHAVISNPDTNILVKIRAFLSLPKIFEKFSGLIHNVEGLIKESLCQIISIAYQNSEPLVKVAALLSFTYFSSFSELSSTLGKDTCIEFQGISINLLENICDDSEDDTLGFLLEALNHLLKLDWDSSTLKITQLQLMLKISYKGPSNLQVVLEAQDCLKSLLRGCTKTNYISYAEILLPFLLNNFREHTEQYSGYYSVLSLSLELLVIFIKIQPENQTLPTSIVQYIFEPLLNVINISNDDDILKLTTEAFGFLVNNAETGVIEPYLGTMISILDKLLSLNTSDFVTINVDMLIISVFKKFGDKLQDINISIIEAAAKKLVSITNITAADSLISVFCYLVTMNTMNTLDLLNALIIDEQGNSALSLVIPKWLESFEVIRGENRIKTNVLALSKLYLQADSRIASIIVNGDIIPYDGNMIITRSISKNIQQTYTKISAYEKIIKLFVSELEFQNNQPTSDKYLTSNVQKLNCVNNSSLNTNDDGDIDDWEDVDEILEYEDLKEFVNNESDVFDDTDTFLTGQEIKQSIRELLIEFFKEVASNNINDFEKIYKNLSNHQKSILSDSLI